MDQQLGSWCRLSWDPARSFRSFGIARRTGLSSASRISNNGLDASAEATVPVSLLLTPPDATIEA